MLVAATSCGDRCANDQYPSGSVEKRIDVLEVHDVNALNNDIEWSVHRTRQRSVTVDIDERSYADKCIKFDDGDEKYGAGL